jgi:hypothetical protein
VSLPVTRHPPGVLCVQPNYKVWEFEPWSVSDATAQSLVFAIFNEFHLLSEFSIDVDAVFYFAKEVSALYTASNPFHNYAHGLAVLQVCTFQGCCCYCVWCVCVRERERERVVVWVCSIACGHTAMASRMLCALCLYLLSVFVLVFAERVSHGDRVPADRLPAAAGAVRHAHWCVVP